MVTGGGGSIGSELVRQLSKNNRVCVFDQDETAVADIVEECSVHGWIGDIEHKAEVLNAFEQFAPDVVFQAAAKKHVTPCEEQPENAIRTNLFGLLNVIEASKRAGVERFVFISTDKAARADCIMGATKRIGEMITRNAGYVSVRFGNVLGSRGSVVPLWQRQVDRGGPLTVTDERMERYCMTIEEAVGLVIQAAEVGKPGETLILDMGKPVRILDLAKEIIAKSGRDIPIKMIGVRPGEVLSEILMTPDEKQRAEKRGNFYVITAGGR